MLFYKTTNPFLNFVRRPFSTRSEKNYMDVLSRYKVDWNPSNKNIVLTQIIKEYISPPKLAATAHFLARKFDSNIALYSVATPLEDPLGKKKTLLAKFYSEAVFRRLDRIFLAFGGKVIYRNTDNYGDQQLINLHFRKIKNEIKSKEDVLNIAFGNIAVGELIYDTYLRFRNKATVDINDEFLYEIIRCGLNIYFNALNTLEKYTVKALVTTYTTYIHHGVIVKICLDRNIPVYSIGSYDSIVHHVLKEFPGHMNNHQKFPKLFSKLENKKERLEQAKLLFEKRFKGQVDSSTAYMKSSSFNKEHNKDLDEIDWSNTVVILAHCFFDSPHGYRGLIFPDFYEWMTYTLNILSEDLELTILVKQHPNGVEGNDEVFQELKVKYSGKKNINFIDKKTSNLQILNSKPKAILTAYGTPTLEFAYFGFPVICIYDNPFIAYNFSFTANSIDEYRVLLKGIRTLSIKPDKDKILECYYMQHLYFMDGTKDYFLQMNDYKNKVNSEAFLNEFTPKMNPEYFNHLDETIRKGFKIVHWEQKQLIEEQTISSNA